MPNNEYPSTMAVPRHSSSLYLVMKQMDLIKRKEDGTEYVVCKTERDANGDGVINRDQYSKEGFAILETIDAQYSYSRYGHVEHCIENGPLGIWDYFFRQLKYFDKNQVAKVAEALKSEALSGQNIPDSDEHLYAYRAIQDLSRIGMTYPDLVEDFVPHIGAMLNYPQDWAMEAAINALGWIGSTDPFLVEAYVPRLKEMQDGVFVNAGERTNYLRWIACISLNEINQCSDDSFGSMEGCETDGSKSVGCGLDVFAMRDLGNFLKGIATYFKTGFSSFPFGSVAI